MLSPVPPSLPSDSLDDPLWRAAWEWLQREQDGPLSEAELAELAAWLQRDPTHRARFDEARRLWTEASLVPTRYVDPDPEVALDLDELRKAFHAKDGDQGGSSTS